MAKKTKERKNLSIGLLIFTAVIIATAVMGIILLKPSTEYIEGQADVEEYRVSSKVPSRIVRFLVEEGDTVHAGDTLVILDAPDVEAKLQQAQAAEAAAQAQSDEARNGARKEQIQGAYSMWQKAKAGVEIAQKTYNRIKNLYDQGVVAAQEFDEASAQRDAAIATEKAARSQYEMAVNGARREDKAAAEALVKRAQGAINEVRSYINETVLTAQTDGEVTEIFPQAGELVGSGAPIMSISVMGKMWVSFNVREDLLKDFGTGKTFKATVPALGNKEITLRTYYMKDVGSYAAWKATKATGAYDMKTFQIKARPSETVNGLRPGMSVIFPIKN